MKKLSAYMGVLLLGVVPGVLAQTPAKDSAFLNSVKVFKEVEVVGKGPAIRSGLDKKVFSVNQSLVSAGGSAVDLLQNVPSLQVDRNGNISLRGATNVKVLVDGKPSLISGGSVAQVLQSIPAASIERVEVITNPSAKYDAEGQGVINIILKKGLKTGYGAVTASAGTRMNYNAGASLNYKTGKVDLYGNYSFQHRNTYSNGFQNMVYLNSGGPTYYSNELFPSTTISNVHVAQGGVDWRWSVKDLLSVTGLYNASTTGRREYLTVDNLTKQQTPVELSNRANNTDGWNTSWGGTIDWVHKFKKPGAELDFDFAFSAGSGNSFYVYDASVFNVDGQAVKPVPDVLQDMKGGRNKRYNIQLDYTLPLGKGGWLEAGVRTQLSTVNNRQWDARLDTSSGGYVTDYSLVNFFESNSWVHAVYVNYRKQIGPYSIQAGLRGEAGRFAATVRNYDSARGLVGMPINVNTNGFYPALFVTRQLEHAQQVQLSYTHRINRPTARELNPAQDVSDPVNYDRGNPALQPEDLYSIEGTYKKNWSGAYVTAGLYYNQVNNVIKHIQVDPVGDVTITIPENLRRAINTGFELIGNWRVSGFWSLTANVNVYERINSGAAQYGIKATSGISWNGNVTSDFSLAKGLSLQVRADYKASEVILQDRYRRAYGFDAGAKYDFWRDRATLSFSARDIFSTRRPAFLRTSDALLLDWQRVTYSARALLSFTWRFGNSASESKRGKRSEDEQGKRIENR
ncbi:MAG: TonB-dependent receptor [Bacteroidetes bacterium]|nr:TonB-dependent receptor [Bacteroidota bacterium]